ncbi:Uncharacterized protein Rs2_39687 [Raphanus sativus]|nr:Uncharacterized protein Rs2_39687 [Raphanus sativus]
MKGNRNGPKPRPESTRLHQSHASTNLSQPVHVQNFIDRTCHASTIYTVINRKPRFSPEKNETTDISPEHAVDKSPRPLYRQTSAGELSSRSHPDITKSHTTPHTKSTLQTQSSTINPKLRSFCENHSHL